MIRLARTVRFCINPGAPGSSQTPDNSFAAHPSMRGLGRYYEIDVTCRGEISPATGYLVNIRDIDKAVRQHAVPAIARACNERPEADPTLVLRVLIPDLDSALNGALESVRWRLTPYYSLEMNPVAPETVLLRQQFEFAASHRLHSPTLSEAENRSLFGKCNNPRGHGHNYRVEPCVAVRLAPGAAPGFDLSSLERLTARTIVERFDHKHLNEDTPEFAPGTGVMPSVENIAAVCFRLLEPEIKAASPHARLRSITVWETDKTSATFPADADSSRAVAR